MNKLKKEQLKKLRRKHRTVIKGDSGRPRLSVYRSLKHIYAQVIDDQLGRTIVYANDSEVKDVKGKKKSEIAFEVGKILAEKAKKQDISKVIFDKGMFLYHGRVKAVAEGARDGGLEF